MSTYPFRITEKEYQSNFTSRVKAIDYDDRYYQNDKDDPEESTADLSGVPDPSVFTEPCV